MVLNPPRFSCLHRLPIIRSRYLAVALLAASFTWSSGSAQTTPADQREYAIKAAFLFHFTQFITWPPEALGAEGNPIRIGVLRPNPFGNMLEEIVREETIDGRPIQVVLLDNIEEAANSHILFIPGSNRQAQQEAITRLGREPILLVSEEAGFVRVGGMVSLVREREQVAILINRNSLEKAGLSASSRLLRLAQTMESPSEE